MLVVVSECRIVLVEDVVDLRKRGGLGVHKLAELTARTPVSTATERRIQGETTCSSSLINIMRRQNWKECRGHFCQNVVGNRLAQLAQVVKVVN
ncbi:hypothetical protein PHLCEN_2v5266 [Hermanssonia centrifuga]|uniref:Uncharacterized protein n=1 Tax=Hermanssonia centrifuga TaxID=98765 RepID=A0A2R6P8K3_9APHY|nr:hypothetical protein PHLCEN_2v5266 [Hermanssonia centrifuga]